MKLNWAERLVVNNPSRVLQQMVEIRWLKKMMPMAPGATALEVGCGRGAGARLIQKVFEPAQLFIMDLDIRMIDMAKTYLSVTDGIDLSVYVADAVALPFKTNSLDALFGFGFLHHVPDWRHALAEVARVLKVGGHYYIEELYPTLYQNFITKHILLHPTVDRFKSDDLRKELDKVKLRIADVFELKKFGILGVATKLEH
jgi:ubiquinone/menaquinone biosynthesis C-methylase UbiE